MPLSIPSPAYGLHCLVRMIIDMVELVRARLATFLLATRSSDDPVAATGDFIHPYNVEHIQTHTGNNPGHLCAQAKPLESRCTKGFKHFRPIWRHHRNAYQEEGHGHGNTVSHHQPVRARVCQRLKEPPGEKESVSKQQKPKYNDHCSSFQRFSHLWFTNGVDNSEISRKFAKYGSTPRVYNVRPKCRNEQNM